MSCDTGTKFCCGVPEMDNPIYLVAIVRLAATGFKQNPVGGSDQSKRYRKVTAEWVVDGETRVDQAVLEDGVVTETNVSQSAGFASAWIVSGGGYGDQTSLSALVAVYEVINAYSDDPLPPLEEYELNEVSGSLTITISEEKDFSAAHTVLEGVITDNDLFEDIPDPALPETSAISRAHFWGYNWDAVTLDALGGIGFTHRDYAIPLAVYERFGTGTYDRSWNNWPPPLTMGSAPTWSLGVLDYQPGWDGDSRSHDHTIYGAADRYEISKVKARWTQVACKRWASPTYDDTTALQCDNDVGSAFSNATAGVVMLPYVVDSTTQTEGFIWFHDDTGRPACCT